MTSNANDTGNARGGQIPQFLNKLSAMVDDPATDKFIRWSEDGTSFYVLNPDQFAKELLGTYYKTDASASFVRQLNMYGFHKVPHVRQGALKSDKQAQAWHYRNPNFRRGRPDLLPLIARKGKPSGASIHHNTSNLALQTIKQPDLDGEIDLLSGPIISDGSIGPHNESGEIAKGSPKSIDMAQIINGLATIKKHQDLISDNLKELQTSNQALWQEAMEARERHRKHQETINRILKFLASLFQTSAATSLRSKSMTTSGSQNDSPSPTIPRIRLMIKDVPDNHDDDDDVASTPQSSVRMEEVDLTDEAGSKPYATIKPVTPSASNSSNLPTPAPNSTQSTTPQGNAAASGNGSGYPFPDGTGNFPGGTFIPPGDALRMLQWLQQNQIFIPGYHPMDPNANAGALTTLSNNANMFNPSALTHAFNNVHMNGQDVYDASRMAPTPNNTSQAQWPNSYRQSTIPSQPTTESSIAPAYPNSNQFLNTLLPLASMTNEPPPPMNMAEVSRNSDRLDQLSNNVQAMEHGIDSLIEGIGLDPLSAASLRVNNANAAHPNNLGTDVHAPSVLNSQTNTSMGVLPQMGQGDGGDYTSGMSDFDLDALLKQLGVAAAASTPPAIPFTDNFPPSTGLSDPYDHTLFNEVNVGPYGSERPIQDSSSTFLNENASTLMPTESSSESHSAFNTMEDVRNTSSRDRGMKRKSEAVSDDGVNPTGSSTAPSDATSGTGTTTPKAQVKAGTNRASKRRK
ncbi:hypothetical protein CPB86DRAFT_782205 [Serendipita vermifera]|nr:hypothetical protein CPB86DRAFT_782205 [Serendipita vermifera]